MAQWDLDVLAASLRRDTDDLSLYAGFLLNTLAGSLPPDMVRVDRKTGLFGRVKPDAPVLAVAVTFPAQRFTLHRDGVGRPAVAQIAHTSGGIVLSTDTVGMAAWSQRLAIALAGYAEQHATAAAALRRLTVPGDA